MDDRHIGKVQILGRQSVPADVNDEIREDYRRLRSLDSPEAETLLDVMRRAYPWLEQEEIRDERARIKARQDQIEKRRDELVNEFPALKAAR
jgi:hypothetical protein